MSVCGVGLVLGAGGPGAAANTSIGLTDKGWGVGGCPSTRFQPRSERQTKQPCHVTRPPFFCVYLAPLCPASGPQRMRRAAFSFHLSPFAASISRISVQELQQQVGNDKEVALP